MKVATALVALCALCGASIADASRAETIDRYRGEVITARNSTVRFEVRREGDRPRSGVLVARNFRYFCNGQFTTERRFEMEVKFHGRRYFEADSWEINEFATKFYEVEGRLRSHGRKAVGRILIITNSRSPDGPECNSDNARASWEARRLG
jgi:hypothetical protein